MLRWWRFCGFLSISPMDRNRTIIYDAISPLWKKKSYRYITQMHCLLKKMLQYQCNVDFKLKMLINKIEKSNTVTIKQIVLKKQLFTHQIFLSFHRSYNILLTNDFQTEKFELFLLYCPLSMTTSFFVTLPSLVLGGCKNNRKPQCVK